MDDAAGSRDKREPVRRRRDPVDFFIAGATDAGKKRKENQDNFFVEQFASERGNVAFAVLCDGMGGLNHGEVASQFIASAFFRWTQEILLHWTEENWDDQDIRRQWTAIIEEQNERIRAYGKEREETLGSTATVLLLTEKRYYVLNVGDSRAYEMSDTVRQLTLDHTVLADELRRGNLTVEQARDYPMSHVLTKCVGVTPRIVPDFFFGEPKADAVYLLCSDGFRNRISEEEMYAALMPQGEQVVSWLKEANERLIRLNMQRGETDNISVVAIYTRCTSEREDRSNGIL